MDMTDMSIFGVGPWISKVCDHSLLCVTVTCMMYR
jgi:hypothetical protein